MYKTILLISLISLPLVADEPKTPAAPTITDAEYSAYYQTKAELYEAVAARLAAILRSNAALPLFNAMVSTLENKCGTDFELVMSDAGRPECKAKPKPPEPPAVAKEKTK